VERSDITHINFLSCWQYTSICWSFQQDTGGSQSITNSTEQSPSWEADSASARQEIHLRWNPMVHNHIQEANHWTILNKGSPVHIFTPYTLWSTSATSSKQLPLLQLVPSFHVLQPNFLCISKFNKTSGLECVENSVTNKTNVAHTMIMELHCCQVRNTIWSQCSLPNSSI
jgi:hypothetical protein